MSRLPDAASTGQKRGRDSRKASTGSGKPKGRNRSRKTDVPASAPEPRRFQFPGGWSTIACALLGLLTYLAYSNSFSAGFVLDNRGLLLQDPRIREVTSENLRLIFQHTYWWPSGEAGLYRPLTTLSYLFNYAVLGNAQNPGGYHAVNFLLHLGNVLLVFALARKLLREFWSSFFVAAVWAVHPVLTESVTNIIGRADLLSALAVLGGVLVYLQAAQSAGGRRLAWLAGLALVTAGGMFSKESAVVIVGVIALYELTWWRERKAGQSLVLGGLATGLPVAVTLFLRSRVLAASPPAEFPFTDNPIVGADFWTGRLTALEVIPRYLRLVLWPATLSSDYSYAQIPLAHGALQAWAVGTCVLAAILLVVALYRWNRTAFFLVCFAAITFSPMLNLVLPIGTIMAERFLYLPAIGLLGCLVMAIEALGRRLYIPRFAPVVLCIIAVAFAARTWVRNVDWHDQLSMAEASARTSPNSFKVHKLLATVLTENDVANANLERSIAEADTAVRIVNALPDSRNDAELYRFAGKLYMVKGDSLRGREAARGAEAYRRAAQLLTRAVAIDKTSRADYDRRGGAAWAHAHSVLPTSARGDADGRWMLAAAYSRLGNKPEAVAAARDALAFHPLNPSAYREIADIFVAQDRIEDAVMALMEGALITSNPSFRLDVWNLYQEASGSSCALKSGPNGPSLDLRCDAVHRPFCAAYVEAIKAAVAAERWDVARQEKQDFVGKFGCPADLLQGVFPY